MIMPADVSFVSVSAGARTSLALAAVGSVWLWGLIHQDGPAGTTTDTFGTPVPLDVPTGVTFVVAAATGHALALDEEGPAWSWGDNLFGQLGDGSRFPRGTPVRVGRLSSARTMNGRRRAGTPLGHRRLQNTLLSRVAPAEAT